MDPGTIIGVLSLTIEVTSLCLKAYKRYQEYEHDIPQHLRSCISQLEALRGILQRKEQQQKEMQDRSGEARGPSDHHLQSTYDSVRENSEKLQRIVTDLERDEDDTGVDRVRKVCKTFRKDGEIKEISLALHMAVSILTLGRMESLESVCILGRTCYERTDPTPRLPLDPSYGLPPPTASKLVGREQTIKELKVILLGDLQQTCLINLWGLSGQGKTCTLVEVARDPDIREKYSTVIYINAISLGAIEKQIEAIASKILQFGGLLPDIQARINFVLETLESKQCPKPTLFIFDNLDDGINLQKLASYLPSHRPYTLVASGKSLVSDRRTWGKQIAIEALSVESAVELLFQCSGYHASMFNLTRARKIVEKLGCLPLAIVLAGDYMRSSKCTLDQFLSRFIRLFPFVFQNEKQSSMFSRNVSTTWTMAMEAFCPEKAEREDMTQVLLFCAVLHNDIINGRFGNYLWPNADGAPPCMSRFMPNGEWNDLRFATVVERLGDLSLVNIIDLRDDHCHFTIHPMVRLWIQVKANPTTLVGTLVDAMRLVIDAIARDESRPPDFRKQKYVRLYMASCLKSLSEIQEWESSTLLKSHWEEILGFKYRFASFLGTVAAPSDLTSEGQIGHDALVDEIALLKDCHKGYVKIEGADSARVSEIANRLGDVYTNCGQFDKAESILKEDLRIRGKYMSASFAKCLRKQGKDAEATDAYNFMLKNANLFDQGELVRSMMGRALQSYESEDPTSAEKWLLEVIGTAKSNSEQGKIKVEAYETLSELYWRMEWRMEAVKKTHDALDTCETVYGLHHKYTLDVAHRLARLYFSMEAWHDCELLYRKIIEGYEIVYGSNHEHTNSARHCHGHTLISLGHEDEGALAHFEAFKGLLNDPGIRHPTVQGLFGCATSVCKYLLSESIVLDLYERTLARTYENLDECDAFRLHVMEDLAETYIRLERWAQAEDLLLRLKSVQIRVIRAMKADQEARSREGDGEGQKQESQGQGNAGASESTDDLPGRDDESVQAEQTESDTHVEAETLIQVEERYFKNLESLIQVSQELGKIEQVEALYHELLNERTAILGKYEASTLDTTLNFAEFLKSRGNTHAAKKLFDAHDRAIKEQRIQQMRKTRLSGRHWDLSLRPAGPVWDFLQAVRLPSSHGSPSHRSSEDTLLARWRRHRLGS